MGEIKEVKATEILPEKDGKRVFLYPVCGIDRDWINIFDPDIFIGIDLLDELEEDDFKYWGNNPELRLYGKTDAINVPEIPKTDEVVLLLKHFPLIGWPGDTKLSEFTEEIWKEYQERNRTCLREYLNACEESASKKVFVVDMHGYEEIIVPRGYRKLFSFTPSKGCGYIYSGDCKSPDCEKAEPLFNWDEIKEAGHTIPSLRCAFVRRVSITYEDTAYPVSLPVLITYVKEK